MTGLLKLFSPAKFPYCASILELKDEFGSMLACDKCGGGDEEGAFDKCRNIALSSLRKFNPIDLHSAEEVCVTIEEIDWSKKRLNDFFSLSRCDSF